MKGKRVSIALAFVCIGFLVGSAISFMVPYHRDEIIEAEEDLNIAGGLTVCFHSIFPLRSYNQSIDISLECTNGSLDIAVLKTTERSAWEQGVNYSAYYEAENVTSVVIAAEISPSYTSISICLRTDYGDAQMIVSISSHWMEYDDSTGLNSLLVAIPFALGSFYYATRRPDNAAEIPPSVEVALDYWAQV
jgi:hypothetical protein